MRDPASSAISLDFPIQGYFFIPVFHAFFVFSLRFWHSQRESNSQLTLRRGLLYPFNYGSIMVVGMQSATCSRRAVCTLSFIVAYPRRLCKADVFIFPPPPHCFFSPVLYHTYFCFFIISASAFLLLYLCAILLFSFFPFFPLQQFVNKM